MSEFTAVAVTPADGHYFCGYYDLQPWNGDQTRLLVLHPPFADREPTGADACEIGVVHSATGRYEPVAETRAWNFQQGCFVHWHPRSPLDTILYNDRIGDRFVCVELNLTSGARRVLPRPIAALDKSGRWATSLNFNRLAVRRPGYGYSGLPDPFGDQMQPDEDGVYVMDLATGDHFLAVSLAQIAALYPDQPRIAGRPMWFNHTVFSDDGARFVFLSRWIPAGWDRWTTAMWAVNTADGGNLRQIYPYGVVSHFDWYRSEAILAYAQYPGAAGGLALAVEGDRGGNEPRFWVVPDGEGKAYQVLPDTWTIDGHCCYTSDYRWILNDTYPDKVTREQRLMLYHRDEDRLVQLGAFRAGDQFIGPIRCDLHASLSRDDRMICFDSTHEGYRRVYVMEVGEVTKG